MATTTAKKTPAAKPAAKAPAKAPTKAAIKAPAKTASKPAAAAKAAVITAPKVEVPEIAAAAAPVVKERTPKVAAPLLKKKELVARVVEALEGKKKGAVKEIVDATLAALGEALQKGESLNLPPFGKARVARTKGEGSETMITLRLRGAGEKNAPKAGKEALAEVGDND